jgi:hypothetical protein
LIHTVRCLVHPAEPGEARGDGMRALGWKAAAAAAFAAAIGFGDTGARASADAPGGSTGAASPIGQAECGKPGQQPCPLQAWMRANVAGPLAANDFDALADGLDRASRLAPDPAWATWATAAAAGAAAAKKSDLPAVRASCKSCHDAWRNTYRAQYRMRPIPR